MRHLIRLHFNIHLLLSFTVTSMNSHSCTIGAYYVVAQRL